MDIDLNLLKESISEYTEEIYAMSINYMRNNNIDYRLTGNDNLSINLKNIELLKEKVINSNDYEIVVNLKKEIEKISKEIRSIIWN